MRSAAGRRLRAGFAVRLREASLLDVHPERSRLHLRLLGRLHNELRRLGRYPLLVIDEVGYIPFEAEAANLFFQLVSARYERASMIVTSNKPFGRWGEVFGDPVVAAAMIDRLRPVECFKVAAARIRIEPVGEHSVVAGRLVQEWEWPHERGQVRGQTGGVLR